MNVVIVLQNPPLLRLAGFVGEKHIQHPQNAVVVLAARPAQAEQNDGQQIVIPNYLGGLAHQMLLHHAVPGDGILPALWRVHADPDGVDLLDLFVMGTGELPAVLGGNHAAAIVYAAFDQRISGVEIVLRLDVDDQADGLPGAGDDGAEADVVGHRPLVYRFVLGVHPVDDRAALVGQHRDGGYLGLALDVLLLDLAHRAVLILRQAGFHDPRQDCFLGQNTLAGRVVAHAVVRGVQALGDCRLPVHRPHLLSLYSITVYASRPLVFPGARVAMRSVLIKPLDTDVTSDAILEIAETRKRRGKL